MAYRVWLPAASEDAFVTQVRAALEESVALDTAADARERPDTAALVCGVPDAEQLAACPRLERLVVPYAGLPEATRALLLERHDVSVHNLHHNAGPVAELAVALLLAVAKDVLPLDRALRQGDWRPRYEDTRAVSLAGRTALVLGYGAIGRRVAHALKALGMRVLAVRRHGGDVQLDQGVEVHGPGALDLVLGSAQVLVVALPLTPATEGILGEARLARLPPDAILVNVGRGPLVDERALFEALDAGRIAGAGLDVWYRYPGSPEERGNTRPSAQAFHELDNVVLSPHRGGLTRETEGLRARALARLLNAAAGGAAVPNRVDLEAGY